MQKRVEMFYGKYSKGDVGIESDFDSVVKEEYIHHQELLKKRIFELRGENEVQLATFRTQTVQTMSKNQLLIRYDELIQGD